MNIAQQIRQRVQQERPGATVSRRGRNWLEHELEPGRWRIELHSGPIHTRDGAEIDTAWQQVTGNWQWQMAQADYTARAKAAFNGAPLIEYGTGGESVTFQARQLEYTNDRRDTQLISAVQGVTAEADDDTLRWNGAFGSGLDFSWLCSTDQLAKRLHIDALSSLPAPTGQILGGGNPVLRLQWQMAYSDGVTPFVNGVAWNERDDLESVQSIEFRDAQGNVLWLFRPPTVEGADGDTAAALARLSRSGPNMFVEVRTPWEWLDTAAYPVVVDPTLSLQPDAAAGEDTLIGSGSVADFDYGTHPEIRCGLVGSSIQRGLIQFDISSIPAGSNIDSATLTLFCQDEDITTDFNIGVHRGLVEWFEGPNGGSGAVGGVDASTWNHRNHNGSVAWSGGAGGAGGSDFAASSTDATLITGTGATFDWSVAVDVQAWVDGTDNYGWWIINETEAGSDSRKRFSSSDHTTASQRPKLVVEYTEPQPVTVNVSPIEVAVTIPTATIIVPNVVEAQPITVAVTIPQATVAVAPLIQAQPITITVTIPQASVSSGVAFGDVVLADRDKYTVVLSDRNQPTS